MEAHQEVEAEAHQEEEEVQDPLELTLLPYQESGEAINSSEIPRAYSTERKASQKSSPPNGSYTKGSI